MTSSALPLSMVADLLDLGRDTLNPEVSTDAWARRFARLMKQCDGLPIETQGIFRRAMTEVLMQAADEGSAHGG